MIQIDKAVEKFNNIILSELKEAGIKCWVAGGSLRDYFMGVSAKTDIDLFFPNEAEQIKAAEYFKKKKAEVKWESEYGMKVVYNGTTFDIIKKYFTTPQETIDAFDFTVSMFAIDGAKLYHGESSFMDLAKRQLMFNKIPYPASSLKRAFRYYKKGFAMCMGEMKKLCEAIQDMPKPEPKTEEQTTDEQNEPSGDGMNNFFFGID